jgi:sugar phosphate isomerase/epimerase
VVAITFGDMATRDAFALAATLDFDHVDVTQPALAALRAERGPALSLPVGDVIAPRGYPPGVTGLAPLLRPGQTFDEVVGMLAAHPGARLEAGPGTVAGSIAGIRALGAALPGLRFTIDTGHIASWGEDPVEVLDLADHVQLRQAALGRPQLHPEEGDVDFAAVIARLRDLDYPGLLSIEYFDLPDWGLPLENPVAHAVALAEFVRPLLTV